MSEEIEVEINRILTKIRILKEVLKNGYFTIIAEGDPDFPKGLKFKLPSEWENDIKTVIQYLMKKLKDKVVAYAGG